MIAELRRCLFTTRSFPHLRAHSSQRGIKASRPAGGKVARKVYPVDCGIPGPQKVERDVLVARL